MTEISKTVKFSEEITEPEEQQQSEEQDDIIKNIIYNQIKKNKINREIINLQKSKNPQKMDEKNKLIIRKGNKMINSNRFVKINIMITNNLFEDDTFRKFSLKNINPAKNHIISLNIPLYYNLPQNTPIELFGSINRLKDFINLVKAKKGEKFKSEKEIDLSTYIKETQEQINKDNLLELIKDKREREFAVLEHNIRLLLSLLFVKGNKYYIPGFDNLYIYKYNWLKNITNQKEFNFLNFLKNSSTSKITIDIYVKLIISLEEINIKEEAKLNCDIAKVELKDDLKRTFKFFNILPDKFNYDDDKYVFTDFDTEEDIDKYNSFISKYPGIHYLNEMIFNYPKIELLELNSIEDDLKLLYETMKLPGFRNYNTISNVYRNNFNEIVENYNATSSFLSKYDLKNVSKSIIFNDLLRDYRINILRHPYNYGKSNVDTSYQIKRRQEREKLEKDKQQLKREREYAEKIEQDKHDKQLRQEYNIPEQLPFDTEFVYTHPRTNVSSATTFRKKMQQIKNDDVKKELIRQAREHFLPRQQQITPPPMVSKEEVQSGKTTDQPYTQPEVTQREVTQREVTQENPLVARKLSFDSPQQQQTKPETFLQQSQKPKIRDLSEFELKEGQKIELPPDFKEKIQKNKPPEEEEGWTSHEKSHEKSPISKTSESKQETLEPPPQSASRRSRRTRKVQPVLKAVVDEEEEKKLRELHPRGGNKKKTRKNKKY